MAHPKRKKSKSSRDQRRNHKNLDGVTLSKCENCDAVHLRHRACPECGYYRGRQILNVTQEV